MEIVVQLESRGVRAKQGRTTKEESAYEKVFKALTSLVKRYMIGDLLKTRAPKMLA